jgi:biopolymer transport protein ExbD
LKEKLQEDRNRPVIVSAVDGVFVGQVVEVLDGAKQLGAQEVSLVKALCRRKKMSDVRRRITSDGAIAGVNIVPVIDLCLVLLVIFLILSPMMDKAPVEVTLPKAHVSKKNRKTIFPSRWIRKGGWR